MNVIVIGAEPERYAVRGDEFRAAAAHRSRSDVTIQDDDPDDVTDVTVLVERPREPAFHIMHSRSGHSVFTDGTPLQAAEVAAWVISTFPPDDDVEVWLTDDAYTEHVVLRPGITPEEIATGWRPNPVRRGVNSLGSIARAILGPTIDLRIVHVPPTG